MKYTETTQPNDFDSQFARARAAGERALAQQPRAKAVRFLDTTGELELELVTGAVLKLPVTLLEGLQDAAADDIRGVTIEAQGLSLYWDKLDVDLLVPGLVEGSYGTRAWMRAIGSKGGQVKTLEKTRAAVLNGKKGGRPRQFKEATKRYQLSLATRFREQPKTCVYVGEVKASNGFTLLSTPGFDKKEQVIDHLELLQTLAQRDNLVTLVRGVANGFVVDVRDRKGQVLAYSRSYGKRSAASRASTRLARLFDDTQSELDFPESER